MKVGFELQKKNSEIGADLFRGLTFSLLENQSKIHHQSLVETNKRSSTLLALRVPPRRTLLLFLQCTRFGIRISQQWQLPILLSIHLGFWKWVLKNSINLMQDNFLWLFENPWGCLRFLEVAWGCLRFLEIVWGCLRFLEIVWDCLRLLEDARGCLRFLEVAWDCLRFLEVAWGFLRLFEITWGCLRFLEVAWSYLWLFEVSWGCLSWGSLKAF